jgi:uncharacterized membrane protein YhaH (DUF805 family)
MDFVTAVTTCLKKYVEFDGRARRSEYWWYILFYIIVISIAYAINVNLGGIASLALLLPTLGAAVRRLHDIGRSGWWILIGFIPLIGWLISLYWAIKPSQPESNQWGEVPA